MLTILCIVEDLYNVHFRQNFQRLSFNPDTIKNNWPNMFQHFDGGIGKTKVIPPIKRVTLTKDVDSFFCRSTR